MIAPTTTVASRRWIYAPNDFANRVIVPALPALRDRYPCIDLQLRPTTGLVELAAREDGIAVRRGFSQRLLSKSNHSFPESDRSTPGKLPTLWARCCSQVLSTLHRTPPMPTYPARRFSFDGA
jgi:DNA-binding transcriptional LysR family regulator